eukprot:gene10414-11330_t
MEYVNREFFLWEHRRDSEFYRRLFNSVFLPEILPGTADPDEPLPFESSKFFDRLKIKVYFKEKWNLMITVQDEKTFSFYRVYPRNEDVVNLPVIQMTYPTHRIEGKASTLFYSALQRHDCDGICLETSSKGGVDHTEEREVPNSERMIQFLLNFITHKTEIPVEKINKKHKNQVLWKNALHPWRRNFRWLGLKILLKEHCTPTFYQQIIAQQLVDVVDNAFPSLLSLLEVSNEHCKRRIVQKLSKKLKKHPITASIIEPPINKITALQLKRETEERVSKNSILNCFTMNQRSFENYRIPQKPSELSRLKTFSPRPPSCALFLRDQSFLYYFDHNQITISRKILYCADWIAREHRRLVTIYPELEQAIFGFELNIFNRLLLPFRKDRDLCLSLLSYFQRYYSPSNDYLNNESVSFALGQRLFQREISDYRRSELNVMNNYRLFVLTKCQESEACKREWEEWRQRSACLCNCDDATCSYCTTNQRYSSKYDNLCKHSIQKLEKCLPGMIRDATILYTELNYPNDLNEFRNNYYHFLTLFYPSVGVRSNIFHYELLYPSYISDFKRYDDSFNLTVNMSNLRNGNYTIFSDVKSVERSHYSNADSRLLQSNTLVQDLICSFAMKRNYGFRDPSSRRVSHIYFKIVNYPSLSVRRSSLQQYLVPRNSDNTVYANQEEGELESNLQYIKYGEVLLGKEIRYRHLISLLEERVLDLNDEDILSLVKTLLWLSESIAIGNKEKYQLFVSLERHVNLISRNCDKVVHMEALIHILNRLLTEEEGRTVKSSKFKEVYLNLMKKIRLILLKWKEIINTDDSLHDYPTNTANKTLVSFLKIADLEVFSYMHENDLCGILKAANFIYENQLDIKTGFSLEVKEVLFQHLSYLKRSVADLTSFLSYKRREEVDDTVVWKVNGIDAYCYYRGDLYEMNRQTGEYLINKNPLKTLPDRIRAVPDIERLFKTRNVKAALLANGVFECPDYCLSITDLPGQVIIEERIKDGTYQYISPDVFNDELSSDLLGKYHWVKISEGEDYHNNPTIEFRSHPFKSPGNNRNTKVNYLLSEKRITNQDTGEFYSDIRSQSFKDIFLALTPHVNIWNYRIELYTLDLTFLLNEETRELCFSSIPLVVNSSILRRVSNKIVLEDNRIIVVWDEIAFHFRYKPRLDYVIASDSLISWLYLAFTYGNSSYHQEAWDVLTTQCFNSEGLTETGIEGTQIEIVLKRIQSLSPERSYYPTHLRRMEKVENYNRLFDGYYLWVYEFLHLRRINEKDLKEATSLKLRIRSFLLNRELYPFASDFLFNVTFPPSFGAILTVSSPLPRRSKNLYHIFEGSTVNISASSFSQSIDPKEAFLNFIQTRSYDKIDVVRLIYLNHFSKDIVTLMSHLPVKSSDLPPPFSGTGQYFISNDGETVKNTKKCWKHKSYPKYMTLSGCKDCESLYQSNMMFVKYLKSQFTTRDVVDPPPMIPYHYKVIVPPLIEYIDESVVGKLRREALNKLDHSSLHNLLNEITGLTLRAKQIEIANHLLDNANNLTTQLNMGEGKTSMILPLMTLRAVFQQHCRPLVIFKRSLFHMHSEELIHKLGLLGVKCFHFKSRRCFALESEIIEYLETIPRLVLLMIPEDKQSFEIRMAEGRQANTLNADKSQSFINENTLTIIDESDDVLHPRNQLIWTYGTNAPIEDSLLRYRLPQIILSKLKLHELGVGDDYLLYEDNIDYPQLCDDVTQELFVRLSRSDLLIFQRTLREVISNKSLPSSLPELCGYGGDLLKPFFSLMRLYVGGETSTGGGGLLFNCLSSKCRVNYGADPKRRSKLAVPYLAKDIPSDNSEFANVDKTILLSYLYYYSEGMLLEDIQSTWKRITKPVYDSFLIDDRLPYESVNSYVLTRQYDHCFRRNKGLINFWLETIVFPKFLNQFPLKRCASSWNLINPDRGLKTCGFSGTNGMMSLQPNTIRQEDLSENLATNHLLDKLIERQSFHHCPITRDYDISDALIELQADVVIDVGSLIIENNETFSKQWLQKSTEKRRERGKSAVLFFDQHNRRLCYDYNTGKIEPYELSKFKDGGESLNGCLVYIDQSHCIGTHYDFPSHFRAVVTLGKNVTRDALAQGCMRMRKLASDVNPHTITFVTNEKIFSKVKSSCDVLKYCYDYTKEELLRWGKVKTAQQQHYELGIPLVSESISIHATVENLQSEQEKELEKEIEEERAIERPPKLEAKMHQRYPYIDEILQGHCPDPRQSHFRLFSADVYVSRDWETVHLTSESNDSYSLAISSYEASLLYGRKTVKNLHCISNVYHKDQHNTNDDSMSSSLRLFFLNLFYPSKTIETEFCRFIGLRLNRRKEEAEVEDKEYDNVHENEVISLKSLIIERKVEEFYHLSHLKQLLTKRRSNFEE